MKTNSLKTKNQISVDGPLLISPDLFKDERGFFYESWNQKLFNELVGKEVDFVQDNHSSSSQGVIRGLHYQLPPNQQSKLVRCIKGEIFDVAIDLRRQSKTFCQWVGINLSSANRFQLWIPAGFAHGFLSLSEFAEVLYKVDNYWSKESERTIRWDDPTISIDWPNYDKKPNLSSKDFEGLLVNNLYQNDLF